MSSPAKAFYRMDRHFPDGFQIHSDHTQIAPSLEEFSASTFRIAQISSVGSVQKPIRPILSSSRRTSPVISTSPWIFSAYAGAGLRRKSSIKAKIFWNKFLDTATSANWNVTYRPWLTIFAPIFTNFSRSVVSDQCSTFCGSVNVSYGSTSAENAGRPERQFMSV